jgi:peptidoglycan hydrolase-like protein with peptidoglycan-binding domain
VRERKRRREGILFYSIAPLLSVADTEPAPPPALPTLRLGSHGVLVLDLQRLINAANPNAHPGTESGIFDRETGALLKSCQRRAGLVVDGICGPKTWEALRK